MAGVRARLRLDLPTAASMDNMIRQGVAEAGALSEGRAFLLFRGVRGVLGIPWVAKQLLEEEAWHLLVDPRPEAFVEMIVLLNVRHGEAVHAQSETVASEEARKFSQHREGRHASMSGAFWLAEVANERCAYQLGTCLAALEPVLQLSQSRVGQGPAPAAASISRRQAKELSDEMLAQAVTAVSGLFPLPGGRTADKYTAMDMSRMAWMMAVIAGRLHGGDLGPLAFQAMLHAQSKGAQQVWETLGVSKHSEFAALQSKLREAVSQGAAAYPGPPAWAACGAALLWPQAFVHVCEYSQAIKDWGQDIMHSATRQPITPQERDMLSQFALALRNGEVRTHGRTSMSLMIEELLRQRGRLPGHGSGRCGKKPAGGPEPGAAWHLSTLVGCARAGLSPKLMWWLNGHVVALAEGMRSVRERSQARHRPLLDFLEGMSLPAAACAPRLAAALHTTQNVAQGALQDMVQNTEVPMAQSDSDAGAEEPMPAPTGAQGRDAQKAQVCKPMAQQEVCKVCGAAYRKSNRSQHKRSRKHRDACDAMACAALPAPATSDTLREELGDSRGILGALPAQVASAAAVEQHVGPSQP